MGRNFYNLYIVITSLEDPGAATLVNLVYIVVYESHTYIWTSRAAVSAKNHHYWNRCRDNLLYRFFPIENISCCSTNHTGLHSAATPNNLLILVGFSLLLVLIVMVILMHRVRNYCFPTKSSFWNFDFVRWSHQNLMDWKEWIKVF